MFASAPPSEEWAWLRSLQGSYHKWSQKNIFIWAAKATADNDKPPKAKHVRRLIIANLRDADATLTAITEYMLGERPWSTDVRVAAKCLYVILVLVQYQYQLAGVEIWTLTDRIVTHYIDNPPADEQQRLCSVIAQRLGSIIHAKLLFHQGHPYAHGNFHVPKGTDLKGMVPELRVHLKSVLYETRGVQADVARSRDFLTTVLWQPMVDETVSAFRLLKVIDDSNEGAEVMSETESLIEQVPYYPYIETTVICPSMGEEIGIPRERWPRKAL